MTNAALIAGVEEASLLIGRLDTRVSASPLAEAWQVRAAIQAGVALAAVDGTPTQEGDILSLMTGSPLPSPNSYAPARTGLLHWRRCLARVELGDLAARLVGRKPSATLAAIEQQEDWDAEDAMGSRARRALADLAPLSSIDEDAERDAARALAVLRSIEPKGSRLLGLAAALREAITTARDPRRLQRTWDLRRMVERRIDQDAERTIAALPSPSLDGEQSIRRAAADLKASIEWDRPDEFGAVFGVVADRLQDLGFTRSRLTCLTGATKRLRMEGRLDERAQLGFLRRLAQEARNGLALLDGLETVFLEFARSPAVVADARSALPEIVYAHLVLPAVDAKWLELSLELHERVTRRFVKRLVDAGLIAPWGTRRHVPVNGARARESTLNAAVSFNSLYERALRTRGASAGRAAGLALAPDEMIGRARDESVSQPMAVVFKRFEDEMLEIDREFGRFWERKVSKSGPRKGPLERDLSPYGHVEARKGLRALRGA